MKFRDPEIIDFVKTMLPKFDLEKDMSWAEMKSVLNVCGGLAKKKEISLRMAKIDELGIKSGSKIILLNDAIPHVVNTITKDGKVTIIGQRGSFNPLLSIQKVLEN